VDSGFPLSRVSSRASSSLWLSIRSAKRCSNRPRSDALVFRHGPWSNAARAALTALSTSAASASATWQISSPVEGLMVAKVLPDSLATQRPLIRSLVAEGATCGSVGVGRVEIIILDSFSRDLLQVSDYDAPRRSQRLLCADIAQPVSVDIAGARIPAIFNFCFRPYRRELRK